MALKWFDGFDYLAPSNSDLSPIMQTLGWWNNGGFQPVAGGRFGGNASGQFGNPVPNKTVIQVFGSTFTSGYAGAAMAPGLGAQFGFFDVAANGNQVYFVLQNFGVIGAYKGDGTLLGQTAPNSYFPNLWAYFEFYVAIGTAGSGALTLKVNGKTVLTLASVTTQATVNGDFGGLYLFAAGNSGCLFDDMYFCDATGAAPYNNFLGNVRVQALLPNGAGGSTQFTASNTALANWQNAGNTTVSDALYVADGTTGDEDLYTVTPSIGSVAVLGVQVRGAYRQDDATQRSAQNLLKSGTALATTAAVPCNESYAFQTDGPFVNDPDTGVGWLPAAVNAVQVGPKVAA